MLYEVITGRVDAEYPPAKTPAQAVFDNDARRILCFGGEAVNRKRTRGKELVHVAP